MTTRGETVLRTGIRNFVWHLLGTVILTAIAYIEGGNVWFALRVAVTYNLIRFFLRIPYDQMWFKIWRRLE